MNKRFLRRGYGAILLCGLASVGAVPGRAQVGVLTQRYDNARTGVNLAEKALTTDNVRAPRFGRLFSRDVDGEIYTQPLYVPAVEIPERGKRSVVYVATTRNRVYAFDAADPSAAEPLWQVRLGTPVPVTNVGQACVPYQDFSTEIGVTGTPVIDPASRTLYVVAKTKEADTAFRLRLHALDIATGQERQGSPVEIRASVPGTGDGSLAGKLPFHSRTANQRPALLLSGGIVYITFSGFCDTPPYHGWILGYDAATLRQVHAVCLTPSGEGAGVWMSGTGPSADEGGNLYLTTGDGTYTADRSGADFGNSVVKLRGQGDVLTAIDWFTPFDQEILDREDMDFGSCGVLLPPGTDLAITGSKKGVLYLMRRNALGRYRPEGDTQIVQRLQACNGPIQGTPVYWQDEPARARLFVWSAKDRLKCFRFVDGRLETTPMAESATAVPQEAVSTRQTGRPGAMLTLSADGARPGTAVLWAVHPREGDANHAVVPGILRAFDAADVTREIWNSEQEPARDSIGSLAKFSTPTVADGKVFLATFSGKLHVYGLLPQ